MFIAYIKGILKEIQSNQVILDHQGLGYRLFISAQTYNELPSLGDLCTFITELHIREDQWQIFGFLREEERKLFLLLKTVSGVGARTAIDILSAFPLEHLCRAIHQREAKLISKIKGIGQKTAERLVVDLNDKISEFLLNEGRGAESSTHSYERDALAALQKLNFRSSDILPLIKKLSPELKEGERNSEALVKKILQELNK